MPRTDSRGGEDGEACGSEADELVRQLADWAAVRRVEEAAAQRSRVRSLAAQAAAGATWVGILLDLAERRASVTASVGAHRLRGQLVGMGRDFCLIQPPSGHPCLVPVDALVEVTTEGGPERRWAAGDRSPTLDLSLAAALDALAADCAPVSLHTRAGRFDGSIVAVGEDVVTVESARPARRGAHFPLRALLWCELR